MALVAPAFPTLDRAQILKVAGSIGVLGTGSQGPQQVMAALCKADVSGAEVARLIAREPALYARVLRVANSAYYGQSRHIATLDKALVLLGLNAVRSIAAAVCLERNMRVGAQQGLIDMTALVHHSLATAVSAESLARIQDPDLASDAFIAGLLHNLGIVVQVHLDAPGILDMIAARRVDAKRDMRVLEAERATVGHEECVAVLFEEWRLPETLVSAARYHHDPMGAGESHRKLAALINLGANLGLEGGHTFTLEPVAGERNGDAMSWLGLNTEQIDAVADVVPARIAELQKAVLGD